MHPTKVLLVEDTKSFAQLLKSMIIEEHGFEVDLAIDLKETNEILEEKADDYFVAIVDLQLPDAQNGEAIDAVIKKKIPVIVFTGTSNTSLEEDLWVKGIADYAHKSGVHSLEYVVWMTKRIKQNANIKVLVVDDSSVARRSMEKLLKIQQYQVLCSASGEEALEVLNQNKDIRVVIIDRYMDGMDGLALAGKIRETFKKTELEIIGISSQGGKRISAQFIKSGADDFVIKPFLPEEFLCRVNHCVDRLESYIKLKELNEVKNRIIGTAAHDIRGPIGAINTASSVMLKRKVPEERAQKFLKMIKNVSYDLVELLSDLLDVSAIESGKLSLRLECTNLIQITNERIDLFRSECDEKSIEIKTHFEESSDKTLQIDRIKVKQVIDNLLTNAIKFTPQGGKIEVFLGIKEDGFTTLRIDDSGPGIAQSDVGNIFKEYTTLANQTTGGEKQTGLGLAIAKKIVEAHNGRLAYSHSDLGGASFTLSLPLDACD